MFRTYERNGLLNRTNPSGAAAAPLPRSTSQHYTPVKQPPKVYNRYKNANTLTPDTNTHPRFGHSPVLDEYNRTITKLEDKLHKLTQEKDRQSRDSSRLRTAMLEKDRQSKASLDRLDNELRRSRRMENELIDALKSIQRLEADNLGLKNTLASNDRRWQEEYNALHRYFEQANRSYNSLLSNVNRSKAYDYRIDSPKRYNRDGKSSHEGCSKCPRLENEVEKLTDLNRELRDCLDRVQERYHQPTKQRKTANDYNERHIKSIEDTYYPGRTNSTATKYQKGIADHSLEKLQYKQELLLELNQRLQKENEKLAAIASQEERKKSIAPGDSSILRRQIEELRKSLENVEELNYMMKRKGKELEEYNKRLKRTLKEEYYRKVEQQRKKIEDDTKKKWDERPIPIKPNGDLEAERKKAAAAVDQLIKAKEQHGKDLQDTTKQFDVEKEKWRIEKIGLQAVNTGLQDDIKRLQKDQKKELERIEGEWRDKEKKWKEENDQLKGDVYLRKKYIDQLLADKSSERGEQKTLEAEYQRKHKEALDLLKKEHEESTRKLNAEHEYALRKLVGKREDEKKAAQDAFEREKHDLADKFEADKDLLRKQLTDEYTTSIQEIRQHANETVQEALASAKYQVLNAKKYLEERYEQSKKQFLLEKQAFDEYKYRFEEYKRSLPAKPVEPIEPVEDPRVPELMRIIDTLKLEIEDLKALIDDLKRQLTSITYSYQLEIDDGIKVRTEFGSYQYQAARELTNEKQRRETAEANLLVAKYYLDNSVGTLEGRLREAYDLATKALREKEEVAFYLGKEQTLKKQLEDELTKIKNYKPEPPVANPLREEVMTKLKNDIQMTIASTEERVNGLFNELHKRHIYPVTEHLHQIYQKTRYLSEQVARLLHRPAQEAKLPEDMARELLDMYDYIEQLHEKNQEDAVRQEQLEQELQSIHHQLQIRIEESRENIEELQNLRRALLSIPKYDSTVEHEELVNKLIEVQDRMEILEKRLI